ncbi:hypothetical protein D6B99_14465 [Arachidicoccus soli]|uniref:Stationary phase survival protein SurE n=1 Tax=Arachidicoccus soli TaxID=2341117 RepID=A0A386HTA6_9BACT|nr:hypothetical protein D6B99_14465 [Arachidicoccus soli]
MIFKKDTLKFGFLLGLLAPFLGVAIYYFVKYFPTFSIAEFLRATFQNKSLLTAVSSISLMANVVLFTIYINRKKDQTAKGIFLITCLYMLAVIFYKLI